MATSHYFSMQGLLVKHVLPLLLLVMSVLLSSSAYSQAYAYNQSPQSTSKGYWKLRTDHLTRQTIVWFYNGNHELIYKEELAHKYVKVTKKNKRRLDEILTHLLASNLVASQVKVNVLQAASNQLPSPITRAEIAPLVAALPKANVALRTLAYTSLASKGINILIDNPKKEKVFISLKEDQVPAAYKQAIELYRKFTNVAQYYLFLDVSTLPGGQYKLEVKTKSNYYVYTLQVYEAKAGNKISIYLD